MHLWFDAQLDQKILDGLYCPHGLDDWHKMSKEIVGIDIAYQPWYILNAFYVLSSTNYFAQDFLKYLMRNHFD